MRNTGSGTKLLGAPIGLDTFAQELVLKRMHKIEELIVKLLLLRSCIGIPKLNFALRTAHPNSILSAIVKFDRKWTMHYPLLFVHNLRIGSVL
jgi:hypothetical protein